MSSVHKVYEIYLESTDAVWISATRDIAEEFVSRCIAPDHYKYIHSSNVSLSKEEEIALAEGETLYCNT